jgi:hypothetical protein
VLVLEALLEIEERGWQALSSIDMRFCERWLDDDALLVVPGMVVDRPTFLAAVPQEPPWSSHRIDKARVVSFTPECAALVYEVAARREGEPEYVALVTSVYVETDTGWRLVFHQQTPSG